MRFGNNGTRLVDVLVGARGTESVETELLVGVAFPAHSGHDLNGQRGDAVGQNREAVLLALGVEDLEARHRDDTGVNIVLLLQVLGGINTDADLGTSGDESDIGVLDLVQDVTTLDGLLDRGTLKLRQVLTGEGEDGRSVLGGQGDVVGSGGLVAVGRAPDHVVGESTEVGEGLDRLVSRTVLTKTNGVVGGDPDGADLGEGRQTHSTGGVRHEVEESTTVRQDGAVGGETVHDGTHTVLTDTVADVTARVVTETVGLGLEVDGLLPAGQVGAGQIGGTTEELRQDALNLGQDSLGELARSDSRVGGGVGGQVLLPALGQVTLEAAREVGVLLGVALLVLGEELVPLLLSSSTLRRVLAVEVIHLLRNSEGLVRVEAELLLELLDVVGLERRAVNTVGTLLKGAVADGSLELDESGLVLAGLGLLEGLLHGGEVGVTVLDDQDLPAI